MKTSYKPILFNGRGSQSQSTSYINSAGNNSQKSKSYLFKNDFSQKSIFNSGLKKNELLSLSPESKIYQKTEGRSTLKSCFKKKRKKIGDSKSDSDINDVLEMSENKTKISSAIPSTKNEPKKAIYIETTNRGINKQITTSPLKNDFDSYPKNYTSNYSKTSNKSQNTYSIYQNITNTDRKQNNYEMKIKNNYDNKKYNKYVNKNKYVIKNNFDNKTKSNYDIKNKYEIKNNYYNQNKSKSNYGSKNIYNNNYENKNTFSYEYKNIKKNKYEPKPLPQASYQTSKVLTTSKYQQKTVKDKEPIHIKTPFTQSKYFSNYNINKINNNYYNSYNYNSNSNSNSNIKNLSTSKTSKILEIKNNQYKPERNFSQKTYVISTSNKKNEPKSNNVSSYKIYQNNDYKNEDINKKIHLKKSYIIDIKPLNTSSLRPNSVSKQTQSYKSYTIEKNNNDRKNSPNPQNIISSPRNNTILHTIVDIKKSPVKTYVLNERKTDTIRYERKNRKIYNINKNSYENHKIYETKNIKKERKAITNLSGNHNSSYQYNYNYNTNISNKGKLSINESKKNPKREYIPSPRKVDVIISKIHHRKIDPQERIKKYTLIPRKNNQNRFIFY